MRKTKNFRKVSLVTTIRVIQQLFLKGFRMVDVKTIRKINHVPSKDKSTINFIWRDLKDLCAKKYLTKIDNFHPIKYLITEKIIGNEIFQNFGLLDKEDTGLIIPSNKIMKQKIV